MSRLELSTLVAAACITSILVAPNAVAAMPTIPDDSPVFGPRQTQENPAVEVTDEAGHPVSEPVHRGDVLLVHGTGFDPNANRGGFPIPVPPGTPNGVFVVYSAFPEQWKPSTGAPDTTRTHPHDRVAWVMPSGTLAAIPNAPVDFRRSIARQAQPMNDDGSFTARVVVDPPASPPGDQWGVYVYAAAGSVNPAEELFVPLQFSPHPGAKTPAPASSDCEFDISMIERFTGATGGGINTTGGAVRTGSRLGFSKTDDAGDGIIRYRGTASATARYNAVDMSIANPWLEPRGVGIWALTAEVSTAPNVGPDSMVRKEIGMVRGTEGEHVVMAGPVRLGTVILR